VDGGAGGVVVLVVVLLVLLVVLVLVVLLVLLGVVVVVVVVGLVTRDFAKAGEPANERPRMVADAVVAATNVRARKG